MQLKFKKVKAAHEAWHPFWKTRFYVGLIGTTGLPEPTPGNLGSSDCATATCPIPPSSLVKGSVAAEHKTKQNNRKNLHSKLHYLHFSAFTTPIPVLSCTHPFHRHETLLCSLKEVTYWHAYCGCKHCPPSSTLPMWKPLHCAPQRTLFLSLNTCLQLCRWRNQLASSISNISDSKSTNTDLF